MPQRNHELDATTTKKTLQATTWYGLPAEIVVSSDNLHRVALPKLALPHPGLVNMIVRKGLPVDVRLSLTALHEFGHLQTLPIPLLHLLLLLWPRGKRAKRPGRFRRVLVGALAHQVVWEVAAESYVALIDRRAVRAPRPFADKTLYALFWSGAVALAFWSTHFVLKSKTDPAD